MGHTKVRFCVVELCTGVGETTTQLQYIPYIHSTYVHVLLLCMILMHSHLQHPLL